MHFLWVIIASFGKLGLLCLAVVITLNKSPINCINYYYCYYHFIINSTPLFFWLSGCEQRCRQQCVNSFCRQVQQSKYIQVQEKSIYRIQQHSKSFKREAKRVQQAKVRQTSRCSSVKRVFYVCTFKRLPSFFPLRQSVVVEQDHPFLSSCLGRISWIQEINLLSILLCVLTVLLRTYAFLVIFPCLSVMSWFPFHPTRDFL